MPFAFLIPSWIKMLALAAMVSAAMYLVWDYKHLAATVEIQRANITRLENNVAVQKTLLTLNKEALDTLDGTCQRAAQRFLEENDLWKKIDQSADPLTDAANAVTVPPGGRKP